MNTATIAKTNNYSTEQKAIVYRRYTTHSGNLTSLHKQRPESITVTLTWNASTKYKVDLHQTPPKLHPQQNVPLEELVYIV